MPLSLTSFDLIDEFFGYNWQVDDEDELARQIAVIALGYPTGRKVFVVQYKLHGRTRRKTLGKHCVVTADEARKNAKLVQADVARGADPSAERKSRMRSPTIKELGSGPIN